jgi:hypothetical protein
MNEEQGGLIHSQWSYSKHEETVSVMITTIAMIMIAVNSHYMLSILPSTLCYIISLCLHTYMA